MIVKQKGGWRLPIRQIFLRAEERVVKPCFRQVDAWFGLYCKALYPDKVHPVFPLNCIIGSISTSILIGK